RQKPFSEMLGADDAEMLRLDRLAVPAHRSEQLGNAGAVDSLDAEELGQRLMRAADLLQDSALDRAAREAAKFVNEFAHGAVATKITISGHVGGEITLESTLVVPMRARGIARKPLLPMRIGGGAVDELPTLPDPPQAQMRVEPSVPARELLERSCQGPQPIVIK